MKIYVEDLSKAKRFIKIWNEYYLFVWHPQLGIIDNCLCNSILIPMAEFPKVKKVAKE